MKLEPHQEELLRRCPDLDPADVPLTWSGAADLDEQLHRNKQKRLAQEGGCQGQARSYSTGRHACFAERAAPRTGQGRRGAGRCPRAI